MVTGVINKEPRIRSAEDFADAYLQEVKEHLAKIEKIEAMKAQLLAMSEQLKGAKIGALAASELAKAAESNSRQVNGRTISQEKLVNDFGIRYSKNKPVAKVTPEIPSDIPIEIPNEISEKEITTEDEQKETIEEVSAAIENIEIELPPEVETVQPASEAIVQHEEKIPENVAFVQNAIEEVVENLTEKEKKIVTDAMAESQTLPFEANEVKTDPAVFIRNETVKMASGMPVSEKLKKVLRKTLVPAVFGAAAIVTFWQSASEIRFPKFGKEKAKIEAVPNAKLPSLDSVVDLTKTMSMETYESLPSNNLKRIYAYAASTATQAFEVVDKPTATLYLFGKDKKLIKTFPVLLGQTKGEASNESDPNSDIAQHATTPAGDYLINNDLGLDHSDTVYYKGKVKWVNQSTHLAIHVVYQLEKKKREAALNSPTPDDNRKSWGCINMSEQNWDKYMMPNFTDSMHLYITPDDPSKLSLNPVTNTLEPATGTEAPLVYTIPKVKAGAPVAYGNARKAPQAIDYYAQQDAPKTDTVKKSQEQKTSRIIAQAKTKGAAKSKASKASDQSAGTI